MSSDQPFVLDPAALRRKGISFSNPHLLNLERQGKFPKRIVLAERRVAWLYSEVETWLQERAINRESEAKARSEAALRGIATRRANGSRNGRPPRAHAQEDASVVA